MGWRGVRLQSQHLDIAPNTVGFGHTPVLPAHNGYIPVALRGPMTHALCLTVNGEALEFSVEPHLTLLDLIRDHVELTGCRRGCDSGYCGACTVLLNGKAVHSCSVLAVAADGAHVLTVEGLVRDGRLHPVQQAFIEHGAIQCGYCTPGMILSSVALLKENPQPSEPEVRAYLSGNLCRCTGYVRIVQAVLAAAESMREERA